MRGMWRLALAAAMAGSTLLACSSGGGDSGQDADAGVKKDGGAKTDGGSEPVAPTLETASARISGRSGKDLHLEIAGADDGDVTVLQVELLDSAGKPVLAFDSNMDGSLDSAEGPVTLEGLVAEDGAFSASATLRGLFNRVGPIARVTVSVRDARDQRSGELTVDVADQPVQALGEGCDPEFVANRCEPGYGCRGTTPVCSEGLAPELKRFAFLRAEGGPRLLFEGTEPEDDMGRIHLEFQNTRGEPVDVDLDGDGNPDANNFDVDARDTASDGTFFVALQSSEGFDQEVPQISAVPYDLADHQGAAKVAKPTTPPTRYRGQVCDPRGFDACAATLVCTPGVVGLTNKCDTATKVRTEQCTTAPVIEPGGTAIGRAEGASLWDTPPGCSSNDPKGRPEGVVMLRLAAKANKLVLSTEHPGTDFDTVVYLVAGCPESSTEALGCADDSATGSASRLELTDVPAGDYLVVVDSFGTAGGNFELSATAE